MRPFTPGLERTAEWWWPLAMHITWQASLLALFLLAVVTLGRRWPSPLRYWLLVLALAKFAMPPLLTLPTGLFSHVGPVITAQADGVHAEPVHPFQILAPASEPSDLIKMQAASRAAIERDRSTGDRKLATTSEAVSATVPADVAAWSWKTSLLLAHVLGSLAMMTWTLYQLYLLRQGLAGARQVKAGPLYQSFLDLCRCMGLGRSPRLLLGGDPDGPVAFGIFRPTVMLPEAVAELPAAERSVILAHELAHHRRGDLWINWVQIVLSVVWWFNPVMWLLNRMLRKVREDCCDDFLLSRNLTTEGAYCDCLLRAASAVAGRAPVGVTLGFADHLHPLGPRFRRIMDGSVRRAPGLSITGMLIVLGLAAISLPGLRSAAPEEKAGKTSADEKASSNPEDPDTLVFRGRVLDPDGKPFAGAELYVMIKSAGQKPLQPKVPWEQLYDFKEVDGKKVLKAVHPKLREIYKRIGQDPDHLTAQKIEETADLKKLREMQRMMQEFYEPHDYQFPPVRAVSAANGEFRFAIPKSRMQSPYHEDVQVLAVADGFGPGCYWSKESDEFNGITVRLVGDLPINGRVIDLQGRPVVGAKVKMGTVLVGPDDIPKKWGDLVQAHLEDTPSKFNELLREVLAKQLLANNLYLFPRMVSTDAEGRFRIAGIGADRVVFGLEVSGPGIGGDKFSVLTRPGPGIVPRAGQTFRNGEYRTYGATFEHVVNPARIVQGTVRDKATGKPLTGVQIAAWGPAYVDSFSDKDGHYQLVGLSKGKDLDVTAWPWGAKTTLPYLTTSKFVGEKSGLEPLTVDFDLVRGVILRGRLTNQATGEPVVGARISYATFRDNPHVAGFAFPGNPAFQDNPRFIDVPRLEQTHTMSGPDGSFSLIVLPGRGLLGVRVTDGAFRLAELEEANKDRNFWSKAVPYIGMAMEFQGLKLIDVPEKTEAVNADLTLNPGRSLTGSVRGPDGNPLVGVSVTGLTSQDFNSTAPLRTAEFSVVGLGTKLPRLLDFYHADQQLGAAKVVRADDQGPLTVQLETCGTLIGRLVGAERIPRAGIRLWGRLSDKRFGQTEGWGREISATTDKDGRFRIDGVIPGCTYFVSTFEGPANMNGQVLYRALSVQPGETKNLGDVPPAPVK